MHSLQPNRSELYELLARSKVFLTPAPLTACCSHTGPRSIAGHRCRFLRLFLQLIWRSRLYHGTGAIVDASAGPSRLFPALSPCSSRPNRSSRRVHFLLNGLVLSPAPNARVGRDEGQQYEDKDALAEPLKCGGGQGNGICPCRLSPHKAQCRPIISCALHQSQVRLTSPGTLADNEQRHPSISMSKTNSSRELLRNLYDSKTPDSIFTYSDIYIK